MDKRNTVYILAYFPFDTFLNLSVSYFKFIGKMKTVQTLMLFLLLLGSCNLNREHKQGVINVPLEGMLYMLLLSLTHFRLSGWKQTELV